MKSLVIAHRGASCAAPENTLASINLAWKMNSDGVEIDVRLSQDQEIVVIHDPNTLRTTGRDAEVTLTTLAELKTLDAGTRKSAQWAGEPIPTLREVLATVPDGKKIVIEIKDTEAILPHLQREIDLSGLHPSQVYIIAFNYDLATKCKALFPNYSMLWLTGEYASCPVEDWGGLTASLIEKVRCGGLDGIDIGLAQPVARWCDHISEFTKAGVELFAWTVNDPSVACELLNLPVHGITTDVPDVVLSLRDGCPLAEILIAAPNA